MLGWVKRLRQKPASSNAEPTQESASASTPVEVTPVPRQSLKLEIPHEKITARAFEIWIRKGRPNGTQVQDWFEAELELRHELNGQVVESLPNKPR